MNQSVDSYILPDPGTPVTFQFGSDSYPAIVISSCTCGKVKCQVQSAVRIDRNGISEAQEWNIEPNPDGEIFEVKRHRGKWVRSDSKTCVVFFGRARRWHDFSV